MKKKVYRLVAVYIAVIVLFVWLTPKDIQWLDDFRLSSNQPYGSYILNEEIDNIFDEVEETDESLYTIVRDSTLSESNFLIITSSFQVSEKEQNNLLEYAARGNNVFISANYLADDLLDTLNLTYQYAYLGISDLLENQLQVAIGDTSYKSIDNKYYFSKQTSLVYYTNLYDSLQQAEILSVTKNNGIDDKWVKPILVKQAFGNGYFYIHSLPYAFSNYYMLHKNNNQYASEILSQLPNQQTFIDNYYKPRFSQKPINEVFLSEKSFKWAFILGVSLILLLIIFKMRRKQRMIPIINPPENRSLEFTKTIGDLYFNTKDNHDLVLKMEKHFKEYLKEKYNIYNYKGTQEQMEVLAQKSNKTIGLISTINTMFKSMSSTKPDDNSINKLSHKLHMFYYGRTE